MAAFGLRFSSGFLSPEIGWFPSDSVPLEVQGFTLKMGFVKSFGKVWGQLSLEVSV